MIKVWFPSPARRARVTKRTSTMAQMIFKGRTMIVSSQPCILKFLSFFLFLIHYAHYCISSGLICLSNTTTESRHQITMLFQMLSSQLLQKSTGNPLRMMRMVSQSRTKTRTGTRRWHIAVVTRLDRSLFFTPLILSHLIGFQA